MRCCNSRDETDGDAQAQSAVDSSGNFLSKLSGCCGRITGVSRRLCGCCSHSKWRVTVEPVVFLYMLPTFMLLPVLQDQIYTKICLSLYHESVCSNLDDPENSEAMTAVASHSGHWIQASTIMLCLPSMISGQLLGTYSDARGRKMPLLGPPLGGVLASLVYVLLSGTVVDMDISWILLASFFSGLGGGFAGCLNTAASYLTQVSPQGVRTSRVGVMECMILVAACVGPLLVSWLLRQHYHADKLFTVMLALHAANVLYILAAVPNVHASRSVSRLCPSERAAAAAGGSSTTDGLLRSSWLRIKEMFGVVCKTRHENRKGYLLLTILAAAIFMFCTAGMLDIMYLFVKDRPLQWTLVEYTRFSAITSALALGSLLLVLVPLSYYVNDAVLLFIGSLSRLSCFLMFGLVQTEALLYTAVVVGCASSWSMVAIRSAMSKLVEPDELGRVFGLLGIVENACSLLASSLFTTLYLVTRDLKHGAVFIAAALLMLVPLAIAAILYRPMRKLARYSAMESDEDDTPAPVGCPTDNDGSIHNNQRAELSLGDAGAIASSVGVDPPSRTVRSISLSSSSSTSSAITPITPSSIASGDLGGTHFPAIVDTNFSTVPQSFTAEHESDVAIQQATDLADPIRDYTSDRRT
uniref:Solute carrier family 46 member 3-like n=1 Tax=Hirondellea gigas TaxID=1518452 RepID=A0A2P2I180_9CRUS